MSRPRRPGFDLRRLHASEGGNVIVLYIAAALLLVGMLWAIIGTGQRLVQKETLQSSADAAAFSAAVVKAKGMNIIAFCNLLMALLLAIVILLRLLKDALQIAATFITAAAAIGLVFGQAELVALAADVDNISIRFSNVEQKLEDGILKAMKGVGTFERGVSKATPALALVEAWRVGTSGPYQAHYGSGNVYTIALPLPLGQDLSLPTKDGTWKGLCDHAKQQIQAVMKMVVGLVVPDGAASFLSKGFNMILGPFESAVCGGGSGGSQSLSFDQKETDCGKCADGSPSSVTWNGTLGDGSTKAFSTTSFPNSADCSGSGFSADGVDYKSATFVQCVMKKPYDTSNLNASLTDKPLPLELADDWNKRNQVRAFTVLDGTHQHDRRRSVGVSRKGGADGDPLPDAILTMAQAEFCSWNGHDDLWHFDWRARLVPFSLGNDSIGGQSGDSTGTVKGLDVVKSKIGGLFNSEAGQTFMKQFLIH